MIKNLTGWLTDCSSLWRLEKTDRWEKNVSWWDSAWLLCLAVFAKLREDTEQIWFGNLWKPFIQTCLLSSCLAEHLPHNHNTFLNPLLLSPCKPDHVQYLICCCGFLSVQYFTFFSYLFCQYMYICEPVEWNFIQMCICSIVEYNKDIHLSIFKPLHLKAEQQNSFSTLKRLTEGKEGLSAIFKGTLTVVTKRRISFLTIFWLRVYELARDSNWQQSKILIPYHLGY